MNLIRGVVPIDGYCLKVHFNNGSSVTLNLESKLQTVRFGMLSNKEFFKRATTDGICIRWDNKIEISISEIFQLAQK